MWKKGLLEVVVLPIFSTFTKHSMMNNLTSASNTEWSISLEKINQNNNKLLGIISRYIIRQGQDDVPGGYWEGEVGGGGGGGGRGEGEGEGEVGGGGEAIYHALKKQFVSCNRTLYTKHTSKKRGTFSHMATTDPPPPTQHCCMNDTVRTSNVL